MTSAIKENNETASDFLIGLHRGIWALFNQERKYRNHFEQRLFLMCVYLAHKLELYDRGKSRFVNIMLLSCPPVARGSFWSRSNSKTLSCCGVSAPTDVIYNHYEIGHGPVDRTKCFTCQRRRSQGNHANCFDSHTADRVDEQFVEKMRTFIRTIGDHYLTMSRVVTTKSRKRHLTCPYVSPKWDLWWELRAEAAERGFEFRDEEYLDWSAYLAGLPIEYRLTSPSVADRLGTPSWHKEDAASSSDSAAFPGIGDPVVIVNSEGGNCTTSTCVLVRAGPHTIDHDGVKVLPLVDGTCRETAASEQQDCVSSRQPRDNDDADVADGHEQEPKRARVSPRLQVRDDVTPYTASWTSTASASYSIVIDPIYTIVDEIFPLVGPATATAVKLPNPTPTHTSPLPATTTTTTTTTTTFTHDHSTTDNDNDINNDTDNNLTWSDAIMSATIATNFSPSGNVSVVATVAPTIIASPTTTTTTTPTTTTSTLTIATDDTDGQLTVFSSTAVTTTATIPPPSMVTSTIGVLESEAVTTVESQETTTTTTTDTEDSTTDTEDSTTISRVPKELYELLDLVSECDLTTTTTTTTTTMTIDTDTTVESFTIDMDLTDDFIISTSEPSDVDFLILDHVTDEQPVVAHTPLVVNGSASSSFEPTTTVTTTTTTHNAEVPTVVVEATALVDAGIRVDTTDLTEDELLTKLYDFWHTDDDDHHHHHNEDDPTAKFKRFSRMLTTWVKSKRPVVPRSPTITSLLSHVSSYEAAGFMLPVFHQQSSLLSRDDLSESIRRVHSSMLDAMSNILLTLRLWAYEK